MAIVQLNARIDARLKRAVDEYCRQEGTALNHFVQHALLDRLEELQDIEDLKSIRHEPTRPLSDLISELGLDDDL